MSKISGYASKLVAVLADKLIGSDSEDSNSTKNFTIEAIRDAVDLSKTEGEFHLTAPETGLALNDDGTTWTKIPNMVGNELNGMTVTTGTLTITKAGKFLINGVSDLSVNKACKLYYGLFVNGSVVAHEVTPHSFNSVSKTENISITSIADLAIGDTVEIKILGDGVTHTVTVDVDKLDVTFWGR